MAKFDVKADLLITTLATFERGSFSTAEFIKVFASMHPGTWRRIVRHYKVGGKGAGTHYSANSRISQALHKLSVEGRITKLDYRPSEDGWGNPIIRYWSAPDGGGKSLRGKPMRRPRVQEVPIEAATQEQFQVQTRDSIRSALRLEAKLVKRFCAFLRSQGQKPTRLKILPSGEVTSIFCDLYVKSLGLVVEAKAKADRNSIRMAIGQLCDYSRFSKVKSRAILLPKSPSSDLLSLIRCSGAGLYVPAGSGFEYVSPLTESA